MRRLALLAPVVLPTLARLVFAAVLARYFWNSAATKLAGPLTPTDGAYIQIFPRLVEELGYDFDRLGSFHWLVAVLGAWAEFALPALIVLGLATRIAALGMIIFVLVQSLTDVLGHGIMLDAWFDTASDGLIADQRAMWVFLLTVPILLGAGPLSLDRVLRRMTGS
ncbi:DoxX family protein [Rhodobacter ferrooxidans]|nr:DoxX family protein [Rhodobacter sp. SW2]